MNTPADIVTVLAGGWSASQVDLSALPGYVIAVNDAAYFAPRWDCVVSMDRLWHENRLSWLARQAKPVYLRNSAVKKPTARTLPTVRLFANDAASTVLADDPTRLNGTHSGFCALNLAYHLRPRTLYLVGFDMARGPQGEAHWFTQYPWVAGRHATSQMKLAEWAGQFDGAARQLREASVRTYLVSRSSAIKSFELLDPASIGRAQCCA